MDTGAHPRGRRRGWPAVTPSWTAAPVLSDCEIRTGDGGSMQLDIAPSAAQFVLVIVPWIATLGWLTTRVLGIRLGRVRSVIVAVVGWFGGVFVAALVLNGDPGDLRLIPASLFFGVMVAMPVAIIVDVFTRSSRTGTRRGWRRRVLHPVRSTRQTLAPFGRMREIGRDARRHNLVHVRYRSEQAVDSPDFARRLRLTVEDAGGMMVKFAQIASTRTDLLPRTITDELAQLQSNVPPIAADEVRGVIEDRVRRAGRDGVQRVRLGAAGRGLDRADPPRDARPRANRWSSRSNARVSATSWIAMRP